jgi:hypothetical protein
LSLLGNPLSRTVLYSALGGVSGGRTAEDAAGYYKDRIFADHRRCSQVGRDVSRQDAAVLRYAPRVIRTMCAQKSARFSRMARDVLAHLQVGENFRPNGPQEAVPAELLIRQDDWSHRRASLLAQLFQRTVAGLLRNIYPCQQRG